MPIYFEYTPSEANMRAYSKLLKRLFPTRPLYIFLGVSAALMLLMLAQHIFTPSSRSLIYMSISLLCFLFGGCVLFSTKKSLPAAEELLKNSIGKKQCYIISDTEINIDSENSSLRFQRSRLVGQYSTDWYYIFCISNHLSFIPVIVGINDGNIDALNRLIEDNARRGIKMKKLR